MFHDDIRTERLNSIGFPKLKGHVKIRLHNPNTWKTEIIEGDNMITDAVSDIFASNLCGAMDYRKMLPLYSKMFGGVLCFADQLDVSSADAAKDYYIPDNGATSVIAHAGQTTFSDQADDTTRGNPLNTSMVVSDGAVTLAWEWGSSAGNGTIKSVGLTHSDVGDAGTGSNSNAFKAMTPNINCDFGIPTTNPAWFIDNDGYGYSFTCSGQSVSITRFPMAYKSVGLVGQPYAYLSGIQKTKTVATTTNFSGGIPFFAFAKATSKLYLFYNTSSSTTVEVEVLDLSDWDNITESHATWTLQTAVGPLYTWGEVTGAANIPLYGNYVYLPKGVTMGLQGSISGYLKVNLNSVGDETAINASCVGPTGVFIPNATGKVLVGKSFVINNDVLYPASVATPDVISGYDGDSRYMNSMLDTGVGLAQSVYKGRRYASDTRYYVSVSKFYLATKYNLPTPVTKSNTQSMVITYTLTEV